MLTAYYLIPEGNSLEAMLALVVVGIPDAFALFPILFRLSSIAVQKLRIPALIWPVRMISCWNSPSVLQLHSRMACFHSRRSCNGVCPLRTT